MIIDFSVKNFRSIREKVTLSMAADKSVNRKNELPENLVEIGKNLSLHKAIVLYGRNASGKSNLLLGLTKLLLLISTSDKKKVNEDIKEYEPFAFDSETALLPVEFEISFLLKDQENKFTKYYYQFAFSKTEIIFENLYFYPKGQRVKLFERTNRSPINYGDSLRGNRKIIEDGLLPNQLFLSKSASEKLSYLNDVYSYLNGRIIPMILHNSNFDKNFLETIKQMLTDKNYKENILELLKAADTGIVNIQYNELSEQVETFHKFFEKEESKEKNPVPLPYKEESLGTQKFLQLIGIMLLILKTGGVLLVDELDKHLHPLLSQMIIKLFFSPKNNPNNAQLFFTTHDSSLMDGELFRRDQMFITEKDYVGQTSIYSLSSIQGLRKNIPFEKWYLNGRLGGIPVIFEPNLDLSNE